MSDLSVFFVLEVEPTPAQLAQCGPVRVSPDGNKWLMTLLPNGNASVIGDVRQAMTTAQAIAATGGEDWRDNAPTG